MPSTTYIESRILVQTNNGWIGVDQASGGYPYMTSRKNDAARLQSKGEANRMLDFLRTNKYKEVQVLNVVCETTTITEDVFLAEALDASNTLLSDILED